MVAVIDIGTNTFHLNIAEILSNNEIKFHFKTYDVVKLGQGGINKGIITEDAFERGVSVLKKYAEIIQKYPVKTIKALATSAVRDAQNGLFFIDEIKKQTNIEVQIINGNDEAKFIYEGAKFACALNNKSTLIVDIGGGSVEFIICNEKEIFWKESINVGAARLIEIYMINRCLSKLKRKELKEFLKLQLKNLFDACLLYRPKILIGTAGSFESFAEIISIQNNSDFNPETEKEFKFEFNSLMSLLKLLKKSSVEQREKLPGILPFRIDMIVIAAAITHLIIKETKIKKVKLSTYALKEGALFSIG